MLGLTLLLGSGALAAPGPRPPAAAAPRTVDPRSPSATLSRAKLAYERGDYSGAVVLLRPLLYPSALLSDEEQEILAHKLLGLSLFFERDQAGAEQEFAVILSLRPEFSLDPLLDPERAVAFLESLRRRNADRLAEVRRRQAEEERRRKEAEEERRRKAEIEAQRNARRVYYERVVERPFTPLALLPFGVPQLAAHRPLPGALLLSGEALLGGASLATWLTVRLRYPGGTFPPGELGLARGLTATYLTTGVLFWGLVITGLSDALIQSRKQTRVRVRLLPGPPAELAPIDPPTPSAPGAP